jgi:hypothetical protein
LPEEWVVVVSCITGAVLFFVVCVVVVVVVGAGFSTTVVHEVRAKATARSGVRMISFFIFGMVSFTARFGAGLTARCISDEVF